MVVVGVVWCCGWRWESEESRRGAQVRGAFAKRYFTEGIGGSLLR